MVIWNRSHDILMVCLFKKTSLFSFISHCIIHPKHYTLKTTDLIHSSCSLSSMWKPNVAADKTASPAPPSSPSSTTSVSSRLQPPEERLELPLLQPVLPQSSRPEHFRALGSELSVTSQSALTPDTIGRWGLFRHFGSPGCLGSVHHPLGSY